jgi:opacity protein-like surface antigen
MSREMTKSMWRFCVVTGLILLGIGGCAVHAQALPTASGPGTYAAVGGGYSGYQVDYGKRAMGGGFVFADVHPTWRYGLEGEARYLRAHSDEDVTQTTYLGGVHIYLRPQAFRPYAKFLVGVGRLDFPFHYGTGTYLALAPGAGVDYLVSDRISLRLIDFEYQDWPQFTYGALHPYGVSAGISIRLNPLRRFPGH